MGNPLICGIISDEKCTGFGDPDISFSAMSPGKNTSRRLAIAIGVGLSFVLFLLAIAMIL